MLRLGRHYGPPGLHVGSRLGCREMKSREAAASGPEPMGSVYRKRALEAGADRSRGPATTRRRARGLPGPGAGWQQLISLRERVSVTA